MVRTRAATKRTEVGQELPQGTAPVPSPTKTCRRDGSAPPKKRRRGKPGELCQLNLDVLFLLAVYVHPFDLLNLARTCKSLRELLMDKASTFVWKTARRQVKGLPDCPDDLTEPEYANLVFYARCHGCGKYAKKVLWMVRRRYCPDCRHERLRCISSCPAVIRFNTLLPAEDLTINGEKAEWVDKEQMDTFLSEYDRSSDKEKLLKEKHEQYCTIFTHANKCTYWGQCLALERRYDLELRRRERDDSIFDRLRQHGYGREISFFGHYAIQQSRKSFFKTSRPLTDTEWEQMWPKWLETMNDFSSRRLEATVYLPRRDLLVTEYANHLASRSLSTPVFDLLPDVTDVAHFSPFREVIYAPESAEVDLKLFESAFEQLPVLAEEWKKQLDIRLAELVNIPSHLSPKAAPSGLGVASSSAIPMESSQAPTDKLRLACAVFNNIYSSYLVASYPGVLFFRSGESARVRESPECAMSIQSRYGVVFVEEAPYIVHACGLDPNVATVEDVDRRNARLKCMLCDKSYVMSWRYALRHATHCHPAKKTYDPESPRWQIINDEHMDAIQAAELSLPDVPMGQIRCLLCHPSVGDASFHEDVKCHLVHRHGIERNVIKRDVHYAPVGLYEPRRALQMVEEGGWVTFKEPAYLVQ